MRRNLPSFIVLICAISILLVNKCFSQQPKLESVPIPALSRRNVEMVAQTLQTYQPGKTTIQDFIRDAGLVNASFPPPFDPGPDPSPYFLLKSVFTTTEGSPWKIYELNLSFAVGDLFGGGPRRLRKYVVGDTNKAICILAFGNDAKLASISPVVARKTVPELSAAGRTNEQSAGRPLITSANFKSVAQTLQSYEVGKTTIDDFIRDANLENVLPVPSSYLNPNPPENAYLKYVYTTPKGGPWKIYTNSIQQNTRKNGVTVMFARTYVVGNTNRPISILEFNNEGKLASKSPEP